MIWQRYDMRQRWSAEDLVGAYLRSDERLAPLVEAFAGEGAAVEAWGRAVAAQRIPERAQVRQRVAERMRLRYEGAGCGVPESWEAFRAGAAVVVTGHQLCWGGGPVFVQAKLASTVRLARALSERVGAPVVPVFWLAGEDHDWAEVDHMYRRESEAPLRWQPASGEAPAGPVGRWPLDEAWREQLERDLQTAGWHPTDIKARLADARPGDTWATVWLRLLHRDWGKHGLLIIDGDDAELKACAGPLWAQEIQGPGIGPEVGRANERLEGAGWKPAAHVRPVNAFELRPQARVRLDRAEDGSIRPVDGAWQRSPADQWEAVQAAPEQWSPNVLLRPLYQEWLLGSVATVGGPGEISYWLQLKPAFESAGLRFPLLWLRDSWLAMPAAVKWGLESQGWEGEDLQPGTWEPRLWAPHESALRQAAGLPDSWMALVEKLVRVSAQIDPTLEAAARASCARMEQELESLQKKWRKAVKQRHRADWEVWETAGRWAYPGGVSQERRLTLGELAVDPLHATEGLGQVIDEALRPPFSWEPSGWVITSESGAEEGLPEQLRPGNAGE